MRLQLFRQLPKRKAPTPASSWHLCRGTMDVTLLNEGGKFVTVDMKKIAKGEKCRMEKDAIVMKVGPGATTGTILVRYAAPSSATAVVRS